RPAPPRYDDDDLFGEGAWDDEPEPATDDRTGVQLNAPTTGIEDRGLKVEDSSVDASGTLSSILNPQSSIPATGELDICADLLAFLERALDDEPPALLGASNYLRVVEENGERPRRVIRPGYDNAMDQIVKASRDAQLWIDGLETKER